MDTLEQQWSPNDWMRQNSGTPRIAMGEQTLTWPGGSLYSNSLYVDSGLGAVRVYPVVFPDSQGVGSFDVFNPYVYAVDGHFGLQGMVTGTTPAPAAGVTGKAVWVAFAF